MRNEGLGIPVVVGEKMIKIEGQVKVEVDCQVQFDNSACWSFEMS
jgi:hypothetical protein